MAFQRVWISLWKSFCCDYMKLTRASPSPLAPLKFIFFLIWELQVVRPEVGFRYGHGRVERKSGRTFVLCHCSLFLEVQSSRYWLHVAIWNELTFCELKIQTLYYCNPILGMHEEPDMVAFILYDTDNIVPPSWKVQWDRKESICPRHLRTLGGGHAWKFRSLMPGAGESETGGPHVPRLSWMGWCIFIVDLPV